MYYESIDTITCCIKDRFDQAGYLVYSKLENLLVKGEATEAEIDEVVSFYRTDFEKVQLTSQLATFYANYPAMKGKCVHDVIELVQGFSQAERALLSEIVKIARLLLVMLATNSVSERSFSCMRRIKTYLRSTMLQERLNAVMVLHVHKQLTDDFDLKVISNNFVSKVDQCKTKFPMY